MKQKTQIKVDGMNLPLDVWVERRRDIRFSIARKSINLRVPVGISQKELFEQIDLVKGWVKKIFEEKPELKNRFHIKAYHSGDMVTVGQRTYTIHIAYLDKKNHSADIKDFNINLKLSAHVSPQSGHKAAKKLISRLIAHDFLPEITKKVDHLNDTFFQEDINKISIKYNHSNWGSCSTKRNLNFSSRLLLAPDDVIDYVIIHELAHLKEANHSHKFWAIVAKAMPNYKEKEKWLNTYGKNLDF